MITSIDPQVVRVGCKSMNKLSVRLEEFGCEEVAREVGAIKRVTRKFTTVQLLSSFLDMVSRGVCSYNLWAICLSQILDDTISKKAVSKRVGRPLVEVTKRILDSALQIQYEKIFGPELFARFSRVILQDATHFGLPRHLSKDFPGSKNAHGESAVAKVQAVFDLLSGRYISLFLCSFRDTDVKDVTRSNKDLQEGDLAIRDKAYFSLESLAQIVSKQASYVSKLRDKVIITLVDTDQRVDLLKELKARRKLDVDVFLGAKKTFRCRLVTKQLGEKATAERRRKAKWNAHKNHQPSKAKLQLLAYDIFITDVSQEYWSADDVARAYSSRWYIEILFKAWKSGMDIEKEMPKNYLNKTRVELYLYARMLQIVLIVMPLYHIVSQIVQNEGRQLSILKFTRYVMDNIVFDIDRVKPEHHLKNMTYYCLYDKRKDRTNHIERLLDVAS